MPAAVQPVWADRFIERASVDPRLLTPHPENWRSHPDAQLKALGGSLDELGWVDEIKVNKNTDHVFNGHARIELAVAAGQETVPVSYYDLSELEERQALATFDPITGMAGALAEQRQALIARILPETRSAALRALLRQQADASAALLNAARVKGLKPSARTLPLDLIYTVGAPMGDSCCLAVSSGLRYGINSHGTVCPTVRLDAPAEPYADHDPYVCPFAQNATRRIKHRVAFVDNLFERYDQDRHLAAVQRWEPTYATVRDIMDPDQCAAAGIAYYPLDQILAWADQLAAAAQHVILIPKYDCLQNIPWRYTLGFSIPSSHGGTPVPLDRFRGRPLHLLGGSWKVQLEHLAYFGDDVVSLDNNYVYLQAQLGSYVTAAGENRDLSALGFPLGALANPMSVCLALSFGQMAAAVTALTAGVRQEAPRA